MPKTPVIDPEKPTETPEVPPTEATETPSADPAAEALRILQEMQQVTPKTTEVPKHVPSYADVREKIKEETGWTDAQVDFHLRSVSAAAAPAKKAEVFTDLEEKFSDFKDLKKSINKELESYPPESHADPVLLEKIYWMERGKKMSTPPTTTKPAAPKASEERPRIAPGYNGFESGSDTGGGGGSGAAALVGEEKELARRMGISEDKWNKSKSSRVIKDLK